ncbi:uncharacterized protein STEHIDRAFT_120993 [Stereum hirsutum FP-91666 SS1]|uniref:uncharacterized protein n=1 Tax=Stereum hirsutum (strain FP-91666) TaxID=721885 RepID=UPI000440E14E|nr:uncharacterized protein STEHIDRAFT_120993 [Stereum hirsutum FP-91666 SS1]EIM87347.1 hypothetical protein STEHIDRAFT_120993 [Stereum hirsutum FP-91666 SS1]
MFNLEAVRIPQTESYNHNILTSSKLQSRQDVVATSYPESETQGPVPLPSDLLNKLATSHSTIQSLPHSSILSEMLPVDGKEVVENDSDHGERAEHVSEEVEGVVGDHPAIWCGSSMRAGLRRNECR